MSKANSSNPFEMFGEVKKSEIAAFSDELVRLIGSYIQLYIGDVSLNMEYDECSVPQNSTIYGKLIKVFDRFVVIDCLYIENGELKSGNEVYINAFQIRAMTLLDDNGSLKDITLNVQDAALIKKLLKQKGV